jgi:RiboL-PSP-HEPN
MPDPIHFDNLNSNVKEVLRLIAIHTKMTGTGRGRRHNVAILNTSGIVMMVSCWEAFVEDLASHAFTWLLDRASSPTVFPPKVLTLASKELREAQDARRVWEIADAGWRNVLLRHRDETLKRSVGRLNTPRPKQVDELFSDLLGIAKISTCWRWHNVQNDAITQRLEDLVTMRGEIAHRVVSSRAVLKRDVETAAELVQCLAVTTSNTVRKFLIGKTTVAPWPTYKFGKVE